MQTYRTTIRHAHPIDTTLSVEVELYASADSDTQGRAKALGTIASLPTWLSVWSRQLVSVVVVPGASHISQPTYRLRHDQSSSRSRRLRSSSSLPVAVEQAVGSHAGA